MRTLVSIVLAGSVMVLSFAAAAKDVTVDLELSFAVDIFGSIDEAKIRLQREGYVNVILQPEVVAVVMGSMLRRVAVTYVEWAGLYQNTIVGWHLIKDERLAAAFARCSAVESPVNPAPMTMASVSPLPARV